MELYDKEESDETDDLIEEKTRYFNEVKGIGDNYLTLI